MAFILEEKNYFLHQNINSSVGWGTHQHSVPLNPRIQAVYRILLSRSLYIFLKERKRKILVTGLFVIQRKGDIELSPKKDPVPISLKQSNAQKFRRKPSPQHGAVVMSGRL